MPCKEVPLNRLFNRPKLLDILRPFLLRHLFFSLHLYANLLDDIGIRQRGDVACGLNRPKESHFLISSDARNDDAWGRAALRPRLPENDTQRHPGRISLRIISSSKVRELRGKLEDLL